MRYKSIPAYRQFRHMKPDNREGWIPIGPYPRITTLEAAGSARNEHRTAGQSGNDPAMPRKREKAPTARSTQPAR
ncbi:hypothetical protein AQ802_20470 [Burkholderia pseudomallei]|uniref:Putative phage integrase n=2 Tax=Burkholderia pseudomallei TaxID=28450 RepID=A0A0E1W951_BURPE|nr:putative phage integrase [Burkholderia pseudomallei Pasteur 52237]EET06092.1 putative phage integrase [Burkholderia pseudomallei 1710a]OMT06805.1 hypothetical protein AQ751_13640 [Burkholderia pseudomallei]OMV81511.1 hypothetical protein AQ800_19125 [Burkholderia pseudomallei]OMV98240.1 hypothetical protein AQ801_07465 [Burkholderia pseudomallei]